jgi:hypothetical protein
MKEKIAPLVLIIFSVFATISFADKASNSQVGIDKMKIYFGDLSNIIPEDANISFQCSIQDSSDFIKSLLFFRYILAPRYLSADKSEFDTTLVIFSNHYRDTDLHSVLDKRKILWEKKTQSDYFALTKKN